MIVSPSELDDDGYDYIFPDEYTHDASNVNGRDQSTAQTIREADTQLITNPYYRVEPDHEINGGNANSSKRIAEQITVVHNMYYELLLIGFYKI